MKKGFTLMETLIVMVVLALIGAILAPAVMRAMPNSKFHMFKKAYSTLSHISHELANDSTIYPDGDLAKTPYYSSEMEAYTLPVGSGRVCTNFPTCFASKVNTIDPMVGNKVTTADGIYWSLNTGFGGSNAACNDYNQISTTFQISNSYSDVTIDINGNENGPNECGQDRFLLSVCRNGKVFLRDGVCGHDKAEEYLGRLKKQAD